MNTDSEPTSPKIGIIISMFPEIHETFILRELVALERHGVNFEIFSIQLPRDPITLDDAIRLSEEKTHYTKTFGFANFLALSRLFLKEPTRLIKTVSKVIWLGRDRPMEVLKNLAVLPAAASFAEIGKERGITHWHGHWANIPTTTCWYMQQLFDDSWSAAIHGEDIFTENSFLQRKLDDAKFSVVCSGHFCKHLKENIGLQQPDKVHLNYHGLDPGVMERSLTKQFNARTEQGEVRLVSVGRLVPTKGHDVVIKAVAELRRTTNLKLSLTLIGSGPLKQTLEGLAAAEGISEHVTFTGGMPFAEVLDLMEAADIFCLAPRLIPGHPPDGIPNVIAEAMALRIPIVSTHVSAIPELVENRLSGRLVAVDDVAAFAEAIASIAQDPAEAERLSNAGYDKVKVLFDQDQNIEQLLALFRHHVPGVAVA